MRLFSKIPGKLLLTIMVSLFLLMGFCVMQTREHLIALKQDLIQTEEQALRAEEAGDRYASRSVRMSSASVHVGAAYFWIVPFAIIELGLFLFYYVRYLA